MSLDDADKQFRFTAIIRNLGTQNKLKKKMAAAMKADKGALMCAMKISHRTYADSLFPRCCAPGFDTLAVCAMADSLSCGCRKMGWLPKSQI